MSKQLQRSTPEAQGIASQTILDFVEALETALPEALHSLMLVRHGSVVAEGWWHPYAPEHPHELFSLSKGFTSTAVGLAVAEGRLFLSDPVLSFFEDEAPKKVSRNLAAMQVQHLLSMSTGHAMDTTEFLFKRRDGNWAKAFLKLPVKYKPGTHFLYNTGASYMLSAIVQQVTGMTLLDYLRPRLFEPLGIVGATWETNPQGVNMGGFGLSVKTEDIAKFGQLYLQKGLWEGRLILPETWVDEATAFHSDNSANTVPDWKQGYGYQFWRCQPKNVYRADGAFGQFCIVMPDQDAVLAITAGTGDMQGIMNVVWERLLPALGPSPLAENTTAQAALAKKMSLLSLSPALAPAQEQVVHPEKPAVRKYKFAVNEVRLASVFFAFTVDGSVITLRGKRGKHQILCGNGRWLDGTTTFLGQSASPVMASGAWTAPDTYTVKLCFYERVTCATLTFRFAEQQLTMDCQLNASFGPTEWPQLTAELV
ncbi:MAG: serine hydrolase [Anaerolineae bacterium]|nr:serine hydrolase [Anaerolineae bacterium]